MVLRGVVRGKRRPPRLTLYGPPGVGKSTFGADAPKPIFVTTEDGVDNLPVDQFDKAQTWTGLLDNIRQVAKEEHDYKTIVIDTFNGAVDLAAQYVCETRYGGQWTAKKGDGGFLAWAQGWKATAEEMRPLLALLDDCRARGMIVLFLAHTGLQNVKHPVDGDYTKFAPDVDKFVWAKVSSWCDIVLRADYEYSIVRDKASSKGRAVGTQTRKIFCTGSAAEDAKCRVGYELPDEFSLSWDEFHAHLGSGGATLAEVNELWPLLTDEEAKATLLWFGVDKLEDAPLTKMRQALNRLRQKQAENMATKSEKETEEEVAA